MFYVSEPINSAPVEYKTELQKMTYSALAELGIPFNRVDTDEAITMEDCLEINKKLEMKMVKTLLLCNRQQTAFYLFITTGDKPFKSKDFSTALDISRVSFASKELFEEMLHSQIGAATIFSALTDKDGELQIIIDNDILAEEFYGCSDGTTTGYMKIRTEDIVKKFLPYTKHNVQIIKI